MVLFFPVCFVLVFVKKAPCNFRGFFCFVPLKGLSLKSFFSSHSVFFIGFPFVFPFKMPFFFAFCPSAPFFYIIIFGFSCFPLFLPFPFLMFACFFETKFSNIPFLKPELLSFLAVIFFFVFVFVFMVYVSAFLFLCWFCYW